uniref:Uncharacterized protein n=1 Tax=Anopheles albimanus TaxID=7167 RepID=A0A182FZ98_ANOAL
MIHGPRGHQLPISDALVGLCNHHVAGCEDTSCVGSFHVMSNR